MKRRKDRPAGRGCAARTGNRLRRPPSCPAGTDLSRSPSSPSVRLRPGAHHVQRLANSAQQRPSAAESRAAGRTNIGALAGPRVHRDDDPVLKNETERGRAVVRLHVRHRIAFKGVHLRPCLAAYSLMCATQYKIQYVMGYSSGRARTSWTCGSGNCCMQPSSAGLLSSSGCLPAREVLGSRNDRLSLSMLSKHKALNTQGAPPIPRL